MIRRLAFLPILLAALAFAASARGAEAPCNLEPKAKCFGVESLEAALSTTQAGAHPDLTFAFEVKQDPDSKPDAFGLKDSYEIDPQRADRTAAGPDRRPQRARGAPAVHRAELATTRRKAARTAPRSG